MPAIPIAYHHGSFPLAQGHYIWCLTAYNKSSKHLSSTLLAGRGRLP